MTNFIEIRKGLLLIARDSFSFPYFYQSCCCLLCWLSPGTDFSFFWRHQAPSCIYLLSPLRRPRFCWDLCFAGRASLGRHTSLHKPLQLWFLIQFWRCFYFWWFRCIYFWQWRRESRTFLLQSRLLMFLIYLLRFRSWCSFLEVSSTIPTSLAVVFIISLTIKSNKFSCISAYKIDPDGCFSCEYSHSTTTFPKLVYYLKEWGCSQLLWSFFPHFDIQQVRF